jgi:hypothetical protein
MTDTKKADPIRITDVIERHGRCLELVPMDPHFRDISVGLHVKDGVFTIWTYSQKPGVEERIRRIRDQLVALGGLTPVDGTPNQSRFQCGYLHARPLKFLLMQAVEKDPHLSLPEGKISVKDTKSALMLSVAGREVGEQWVYEVSADGEAPNRPARLRALVQGFRRYGEAEQVSDTEVIFPCGYRHDQLARLLLPYARNVSAVENMMESAALRGQLTTGTAGFTPPT